MKNIAYHILDIVHNSVNAKANLVEIIIKESTGQQMLELTIKDNGRGMTEEEVESASDPYFTKRKTRHVGMGLPLLKQNAEQAGGEFKIDSFPGKGTLVYAVFNTGHIDCPPLGDISGVVHSLMTTLQGVDVFYKHEKDENEFCLDTREVKEITRDTPLYHKEISKYLKEMIVENLWEIGVKQGTIGYTT
ncbi:MAG: ATP-binding protein [Bacteroidales bacterium]